MSFSKVDIIWSLMRNGELYSPRDLANSSGQSIETVVRVLGFLWRYGFAERVVEHELIFKRVEGSPRPGDALKVLQSIVGEDSACATGRVVSTSGSRRRLSFP